MAEKFSNFARTTLAASLTDVATTLTVEYATNFPTSGDFRVRCQNELMLVTNVSGTTFTVTRGVEGTTAAAHDAGVGIAHVMTAASLDAAIDQHVHASDLAFAADSTYDIGSATVRPANVYADLVDTPEVVSQGELVLNTQTGVTIESGLEIGHESKWSIDNDIIPMNLDGQQYIGYDDGAIDERVNIYGRTVNIDDDLTVESEDIPIVTLRKADPGPALVDDDDVLGVVSFQGYDGAAYVESAVIRARIDGTTGASGDLPTELLFSTKPDGAGAIAERWRISPAGQLEPMVDYSVNIGGPTFRIANLYAGGTLYSGGLEMTHVSSTNINFIRDDTAITDGEHLGALYFRGKDTGGTTRAGSSIIGEAAGANGASYVTGKLLFGTTPSGGPLTDRWEISNTGHLIPAADSTYDIGTSSVRPANIYADVVTTESLTGLGGLSLINASGYANIELDGSSGSYIDFHGPNSTDYGVRLIETDTTSGTAQGDLVFYGNAFLVQGGADLGSNVDANTWQNVYLRYLWKPTLKAWYTGRPVDATLRYFKIASGTIGAVNENSTGSVLLQQTDLNSADYKGRGLLQFNIRHSGTGVDPQVAMSLLGLDEYISTDDVVLVCTNNVTTTDWSLYLRVNDAWECWWFQPLITGNAYQDVDSDPAWNIDTTGVTTLPTGTQYKPVFANIQAYKLNMGTGGDTLQPGSLMLTTPSDTAGFETILYLRRASASGGIVPAGASVGRVQFSAHDGNSQRNVAHVDVLMDGTIGSNDMPTKMVFGTTTDGQSSSTDRWAIRAAGHFEPIADGIYSIGATYPNRAYEVIAYHHIAEGFNVNPDVTLRRYDQGGISSGDTLGEVRFQGKDAGGVWRTTAEIRAVPMETWGNNTSLGTNLRFLTTASGGNSASIRWMITDAGHLEPWSDSTVNIGSSSDRVQDIYAETLRFPATQVASSGANDFDDYEEGTWTPTITFTTPGDLSVVYSKQLGWYRKVGNQVQTWFRISTSTFTHTTATGTLFVSGLPFTNGVAEYVYGGGVAVAGWTAASAKWITARMSSSASTIAFVYSVDGGSNYLMGDTHFPTGAALGFNGDFTYYTA